ncbi:hypothetical protein ACOMHN_065198 [Nucella lapillus]
MADRPSRRGSSRPNSYTQSGTSRRNSLNRTMSRDSSAGGAAGTRRSSLNRLHSSRDSFGDIKAGIRRSSSGLSFQRLISRTSVVCNCETAASPRPVAKFRLLVMPVYIYRRGGNRSSEDDDNEDHLTVDEMVVVERPILTELDFEQGFEKAEKEDRTPLTWLKKKAGKCACSCSCFKSFLLQVFPFVRLLRGYGLKSDLPADIVAGLTVGIMHIPQGMAYGQLSTLPPVYGLYVSFFPVILYFFLGTSKHVSVGTFAVVSLMVGSVVDKGVTASGIFFHSWNETVVDELSGNLTYQVKDNGAEVLEAKLGFAMAVTFAVGCVQLLLGLLRLGFLTVYLSDPLISGFTTGAACHVFTSQIKHIFGVEIGRYYGPFKLIYSYRDFFVNLPTTNAVTLIASLVCIMVLVVIKEYINNNPKIKPRLKMPIPVELCVVVLGTVISHVVKLEEVFNVKIVGDVPVGIPPPKAQQFHNLKDVLSDSIALGIVAFAISVSMAKILAKKHDYDIDSNQELLAYGILNIVSSFFSSFCAAASLSRSLVQDNVGGRTQVAGLVSSALLLVVLLVLGTYFKTLPNCILAAIIVVALKGMFKQFAELKRLWGISTIDFSVWLVSFLATVLLDVDLGLLVGIIFALLTVIIRQQRPRACLLGQVPGTDLYKDVSVIKAAESLDHIRIFRFESALFFANSEYFKTSLYKMTADPAVLKKRKKRADKELLKTATSEKPTTTLSTNDDSNPTTDSVAVTGDSLTEAVDVSQTTDLLRDVPNEIIGESLVVLPTVTDIYFIIIDCTTIGYVDSVGVKVLQQVIMEMRMYSIQVFFAHCKAAVREMFEKTNFYKTSDKQCLFLTVHDAVLYSQRLLAIVEGEGDGERLSLESIQEHSIFGSTEAKLNNGNLDVSSPPDNTQSTALGRSKEEANKSWRSLTYQDPSTPAIWTGLGTKTGNGLGPEVGMDEVLKWEWMGSKSGNGWGQKWEWMGSEVGMDGVRSGNGWCPEMGLDGVGQKWEWIGSGALIGLVAGGVVLFGALVTTIGVTVYLCRQRKAKRSHTDQADQTPEDWNSHLCFFSTAAATNNTSFSGPDVCTSADSTMMAPPHSDYHTRDSSPRTLWLAGPGLPVPVPVHLPAYQPTDPFHPAGADSNINLPPITPPPSYRETFDGTRQFPEAVPAPDYSTTTSPASNPATHLPPAVSSDSTTITTSASQNTV